METPNPELTKNPNSEKNPQNSFLKILQSRIEMEINCAAQYDRVLSYFDEDGDGKISPSELRNRLGLMGGELLQAEAEAAVESLDSDGDGLLCAGDFERLLEVGEEEKLKDLKEAFALYDCEGCGFITPKNLKKMLRKLGERKSTEECKLMIRRFDLNGDGLISFEEFQIMMA
ncbi:putative calcium-binding protein CML19 [Benincasa hispida]|uniref:putative calcium-binding protein CML19 n=1 Tax=Benincasa hispida TaxID=102211 RepID=UPI0018FFD04E|nr:putative calcium-binding protein CML19 [Benincasa hispida]